jgi:hypothetical protein
VEKCLLSVVCQPFSNDLFPGGDVEITLGERYVAGTLTVTVDGADQTDTVSAQDADTGVVTLDPTTGTGPVTVCYDRIGATHVYRAEVWDSNSDFSPAISIAVCKFAKNIGYADYAQDVPEAFFTLNQDDPMAARIAEAMDGGVVHLLIFRDGILVWNGWILTRNATREDVIFYAYGYLAALYWMHSDWNVQYVNTEIGDIVFAHILRAGTLPNTMLSPNWIVPGTIEEPATTSGGSTPIILPTYNLYWKRILQVMREMVTLGMGDTTNSVLFEYTFEREPKFNFWKNIGQDRPNIVWTYPGGFMRDFQEETSTIYRRNDLLVAGASASDDLLRTEVATATDQVNFGLRQESIFFAWVRDSVELQRGAERRAAVALKPATDLTLIFHPNVIDPPYANGNAWRITDRVRVRINRGATQVDAMRQVIGYQVLHLRGAEHVRVLTQMQPGT